MTGTMARAWDIMCQGCYNSDGFRRQAIPPTGGVYAGLDVDYITRIPSTYFTLPVFNSEGLLDTRKQAGIASPTTSTRMIISVLKNRKRQGWTTHAGRHHDHSYITYGTERW